MQQQELQDDKEQMQRRLKTSSSSVIMAPHEVGYEGIYPVPPAVPSYNFPEESDEIVSSHEPQASCVVLAYGAESDRVVGVPGEGNVALDVARILQRPTTELAKTDIADHALASLQTNSIRYQRSYYSSRSLCEIETGNFTFIKPIPPCRNVLADVFPIPQDVFGLEDLIGVLSYEMNDPKYAYPYPAQGYYQGPPVMAPPQYAAPPPRRQPGFLRVALHFVFFFALLAEVFG
ncbi:hypothetical protein IFM89_022109 [Coptis chinensis]|uniref:Uncharacterized protein n=1 Tax=Coptis chinensis TaxID=261450 RepID=A0A835IC81_9MAGN|nr:hypothetical protein IFM89_022109 [Coptis chinensis]